MVLHLLLSLGCTGTRRVLQELSTVQRAAGWQLTLPGPKDCINFHSTHGFKQSLASAQALGLIHHPPVFQGRAQPVL